MGLGVRAAIGALVAAISVRHSLCQQPVLFIQQGRGYVDISWASPGSQVQTADNILGPWENLIGTIKTNRVRIPASESSKLIRLNVPSFPTKGLVAFWPLNNNAIDLVGGHHGVIYGATPTSNRRKKGYSALAFESGSFVKVPDHPDLSVATSGEFTVCAWIRVGTLNFPVSEGTGYVYWMGKGDRWSPGNQEWGYRMYNTTNTENPVRPNAVSFYVWNPWGKLGSGSRVDEAPEIQVWVHFAATINVAADRIVIYKNGIEKDHDTVSSFNVVPQDGDAPLYFGTMNLNSFFVGSIDNVMIYNRELSASEIMQVFVDETP